MSVFGIRRKIKAGVKKALGMEEGPSDTAAPNWQNRPPAPTAAKAAPEEPAPVDEDSSLTADAAPTEEAPAPETTAEPEPVEEAQAASDATEVADAGEPGAESISTSEGETASDDVVGEPLTMEAVQEILDDMVRPALQGDGGDISLLKIEDNDVYVKLVGACTTCPSSIMTMKMGVEALLREEFPSMRELIQVDAQPVG